VSTTHPPSQPAAGKATTTPEASKKTAESAAAPSLHASRQQKDKNATRPVTEKTGGEESSRPEVIPPSTITTGLPLPIAKQGGPIAGHTNGVGGGNGGTTAGPATGGGGGRETTWQKLSNRIKSLERNVSLSTGFLEELSLKYIKQIDELNTAVKMMSESIGTLTKREEACKAKGNLLEKQVEGLTEGLADLEGRLAETQEEMMSRHGLLVLLEICVLGLVMFWCSPSSNNFKRKSVEAPSTQPQRRLSLDAQKAERVKDKAATAAAEAGKNSSKLQRRKSIEVGTLCNGHVGSMIEPLAAGSRRQRRKRRRKEGGHHRPASDHLKDWEEEGDDNVYLTYQGNQGSPPLSPSKNGRKRSNSWSEIFDIQDEEADVSTSKLWENHVHDVIKSTRFLVSQVAGEADGRKDVRIKTSRSSSRSKDQYSRYSTGPPAIKLTNLYDVLDSSVHDVETETETESDFSRENRFLHHRKIQRSKSTSPSRHANQLKRQKVMFKNFRPEEAEWLQ